jgi:hypothetical protein
MAKLIFSLDHAFLGEFTLDKERMTIGRRPSNDIHIDNLAISGEHAVIKTIGKDAFLEDLGSTNGTVVNGKQITQHLLQHGDIIELGKYQLRYIDEAAIGAATAAVPPDDFEKTMIIRPNASKAVAPAAAAAPAPAPQPEPKPAATESAEPQITGRIQVLSGASMGKELVLNKALTTLGKPGVQVAVITRRPQGYFITHVEGQQHPVVNGKSVGVQAYALNDHDVIELAGVKMEFYLAKG